MPAGTGRGVGAGWGAPAGPASLDRGPPLHSPVQPRPGPLTRPGSPPSKRVLGKEATALWRAEAGGGPCTPWPSAQPSPAWLRRRAPGWQLPGQVSPACPCLRGGPEGGRAHPVPSGRESRTQSLPTRPVAHPPQGHPQTQASSRAQTRLAACPGPPSEATRCCHLEMCTRWVRRTGDHTWPRGCHRRGWGRSGGEELWAWP